MTKEILFKIFPFLEWIGKLKDKKILKSDIIAGLTVAFIVIPQSMAYAGLAGLDIEVGLYTAFIAVLVAGLFGSSKQMSTGPITIISLMTATAISSLTVENPEAYIVYASLLAFFIGIFYIILSLLRLGIIVDFLSNPVIIGFTNAVALITIISQSSKLFGVEYSKGENIYEGLINLTNSIIQNIHIETFLFGLMSILLLLLLMKYAPKLPRILILLIVATFFSYYVGFDGKIIKEIPSSFPSFSIPFLSEYVLHSLKLEELLNIIIFAVIIGLIGFTQTISVAKLLSIQTKQKVNANRELMGQGIANISTSLFGGYGVAGSLSKTAVNVRSGAKTGFSSVITSIVVLITILYLTPLLYYLPMVTLAAVIIVSVANIIKIKPIIKAWKTERNDGIIAIITFLLTLFLSPKIEIGIVVGVILSLALFISQSMRPRIIEVSMYKDGIYRDTNLFGLKTSKHISVIRSDGVLYFANAGYFEDKILELISNKNKLKYVIIDLEWVSNIDTSGIEVLNTLINRLNSSGVKVLITSIKIKVLTKLKTYGFIKQFGKKYIFLNIETALKYIYEKKGKDIDLETLFKYKSTKNGKNEESRDLIKKYVEK